MPKPNRFQSFVEQRVSYTGTVQTTIAVPMATKVKVAEIAERLNRSSADVYRELIEAGLPDLVEALREVDK